MLEMVHKYRSPCFRDLGPHRGDAHGLVASAVGALRAHAAEVCDGERTRILSYFRRIVDVFSTYFDVFWRHQWCIDTDRLARNGV